MPAKLAEAFGRAFGILVFAVVALWLINRAFPTNWLLLCAIYGVLVPIAFLYGWLTDPALESHTTDRRRRIPKLPLIAVGVAIAAFGYGWYKMKIDAALYAAGLP